MINCCALSLIGFFDMESTTEDVQKEIAKCMDMAKDGIHAVLLVFSAASRFSCEDANTIESIKLFFGDKILDHAILVLTHGDEVGGMIGLKEMLSDSATPFLQVNFIYFHCFHLHLMGSCPAKAVLLY
jgi:hypothetical protein